MTMKNHMEYSIYESISKTDNAKELLDVACKKYIKFSNNELLNTLHSTFYDGTSKKIIYFLICF